MFQDALSCRLALLLLLAQPAIADAASMSRIYGGAPSGQCAWPTTVLVALNDGGLCSGTLVAPQIVLYAAHCGSNVTAIGFGEDLTQVASRVASPSYCRLYPGHAPDNGSDFAYCKLATPMTDIPIVPIAMGCEQLALRPGKHVVLAGFGQDNTGAVQVKHNVTTLENNISANKVIVGGNGQDTCFGDSGGPAYMQLTADSALGGYADDSWRIYGVTSYSNNPNCGFGGYDSLASDAVPWIEADSGVDITPCTDALGNWAPGPHCGGFPLHPDASGSSWALGCGGGAVSGPGQSCGPPLGYAGPSLSLALDPNGFALAGHSRLSLVATLGAASPFKTVSADIDGAPLAEISQANRIYTFGPLPHTPGLHTLTVTVIDAAGMPYHQQLTYDLARPGGCAATGVSPLTGLVLLLGLVGRAQAGRRHRPRFAPRTYLAGLVCLASLSAHGCGNGDLRLGREAPPPYLNDPNGHLTHDPKWVTQIAGQVAGISLLPLSSFYQYSTVDNRDGLVIVLASAANYCDQLNLNQDLAGTAYYRLELVDARSGRGAPPDSPYQSPTSGTYQVVDPNSQGRPSLYAYANLVHNDASCNNSLDPAASTAHAGTIALQTVFTAQGAFVEGQATGLLFGPQKELLTASFRSQGCTLPERRPKNLTCR